MFVGAALALAREFVTFDTMRPLRLPLLALLLAGCSKSSTTANTPQLAFTVQPSSATAGTGIAPAVAIQDASGNTVTSATNLVTVALGANPGGGSLSGATTLNAVNGVATFSGLSINKAGSGYTLVASSTPLTSTTSAAFTITPAAAAKLAFTGQPSSGTAGVALAPVAVAIQDAFGNTVTGFTGSVTMAIGNNPFGGTLSGMTTVTASGGVAQFTDLRIDRPGIGYTLTASAGTLVGATSVTFGIGFAFTQVSAGAGGSHTCGMTTGGAAYCWGYNSYGELGDGTTTNRTSPVLVLGGLSFPQVSAGASHTCGVTTGGAAYCWGDNSYGDLGNGTTTSSVTPVAVSGGLTFATVSAGGRVSPGGGHTCGLTPSGAAYCWGENGVGQLGNGTTYQSWTPVAVSSGLTFAQVSAGVYHTCGVTTGGAAYCWGDNRSGALGNGTTYASVTPVAVSGGLSFAAVSAGAGYTCGVTTGGAAYCWGDNNYGELGNGTTTSSVTPVAVSGGLSFTQVSPAGTHTCGVTTGGAAYCWGHNGSGELGNGTTTSSVTPVGVSGGLSFTQVSSGAGHACGVTTGGPAYCWGYNGSGELGDGMTTNSSRPVRVGP